jgi:hypothetical protein
MYLDDMIDMNKIQTLRVIAAGLFMAWLRDPHPGKDPYY